VIRLTFETSGTTGEPKGITHSLDAMIANAEAFNKVTGINTATRMYHCLPRTHMSGFLNTILCPTIAGGTVAFGPTFSAQTASNFWADLQDRRANTVWITPTMAAMLLRVNRLDKDVTRRYGVRLHTVFCGTAPLPVKIRNEWRDTFGVPLQESYGTSEQMLVSVQSRKQAAEEHNVGTPLPGMRIEIGAESEILVNGSPTGDQGEIKDNRLTITGRIKDLIIRGGFNVSPVRVEEALRKIPGVMDAAVIGQPDEFWGEKIIAFTEGGDLYTISSDCRGNLPKSHWPDVIHIVDKLPRNAMGKVIKGELRSRLAV
jgi:acyl-CoA synthetase (AMP-forming)/AMP-acid ligase II